MAESLIPLRVSNGKAYVWDVEDIGLLRSKHRICGLLTGTLPQISQQNVFLGVPLVLMPEEAVLLVTKGFAALVDDPMAHTPPTTAELKRWADERQAYAEQRIALIDAEESKKAGREMSEEALAKRRQREERRLRAQSAAENEGGAGSPAPTEQPTAGGPSYNYTVPVPTTSDEFDWYRRAENTYLTLEEAKTAGIWTYPSTLHERARCEVFRDLWEKGFYMGIGIKFGGDYLVYPGDPLRYHSHFAASVYASPISALHPMEIVAHGRLGTATKKAHLLCGWDEETEEVSHLSVEWAGFG